MGKPGENGGDTPSKEKGKIRVVVPQIVEFENVAELLKFFNVTEIKVIKADNIFVGGRAEIYYNNRLKPTRCRLFINEDGTLRSPMRNGEVESPVDKGTPWTKNGRTTMLYETYVPNALLAQVESLANTQIPARPDLYKKQQEELAKRKAEADKAEQEVAANGSGASGSSADDNPFDPNADKKDDKPKSDK